MNYLLITSHWRLSFCLSASSVIHLRCSRENRLNQEAHYCFKPQPLKNSSPPAPEWYLTWRRAPRHCVCVQALDWGWYGSQRLHPRRAFVPSSHPSNKCRLSRKHCSLNWQNRTLQTTKPTPPSATSEVRDLGTNTEVQPHAGHCRCEALAKEIPHVHSDARVKVETFTRLTLHTRSCRIC